MSTAAILAVLLADQVAPQDIAPQNTELPVLSPSVILVAEQASVSTGAWRGRPNSFTFGYQWEVEELEVPGATGNTFFPTDPDHTGAPVRCKVTATNAAGSTDAYSASTLIRRAPDVPIDPVDIDNTSPAVDDVLTCDPKVWIASPIPTFTFQWQRDQVDIQGETAATYTVVVGDIGSVLRCRVTATNTIGSADAFTAETDPVIA